MNGDTEISAVIPVYNDRPALERAIPESLQVLETISREFELIIAEDGSTDGSFEYIRSWEEKDHRVRLLHSDERQGRGNALNRAFGQARGRIVCYYDVDLATDMTYLPALIGAIRKGYDIATGSRLLPDSNIRRSGKREIASRGYNTLVRTMLGSRLYDHQCGFKAFHRDRVMALLPRVKAGHWFWDTELLVRAQKEGYKVCELPVHWEEGPGTTVRKNDVIDMGTAILRLWWQLNVSKD
ncbi:MAG TPA: dolichyl-phosphate beta-glucosyltransferase [Methanoregulaceae archaeon]|nr:dolichyl-phosphate beta-glucosyltransferase [Methanoregulaceae archaeon]